MQEQAHASTGEQVTMRRAVTMLREDESMHGAVVVAGRREPILKAVEDKIVSDKKSMCQRAR